MRRWVRTVVACAAVVALGALTGCTTPAGLDHQEQVAFARECTSLIERNIAGAKPPVRELSGQTLDLANPASFYSTLERLRGPDTFDFNNPTDVDRSPKDKLDEPCRPRTPSSTTTTSTTTSVATTTTTATTAPGP